MPRALVCFVLVGACGTAQPSAPSEADKTVVAPESSATAFVGPEPGITSPTLLAEARLLARMRDGLEAGDADAAWDAVIDHEQRFPEGELWPDREVFAIATLVQQGEDREAQLRAEIFLETHENCAHGQRVLVLIAGLEPY